MSLDSITWGPMARIDKYSPEVVEELTRILGYEPNSEDFKRFSADPYAVTEVEGNLLTTLGRANLTNLLIGGGGDPLTTLRAFCGVGTSTTAAAATDTALIGTAYYMNFTSVTRTTTNVTNDAVVGVATYASGVANHAWEEWGWCTTTAGTITPGTSINVSSGTEQLINRKVASMGTKGSGASWVFTTTVTFS